MYVPFVNRSPRFYDPREDRSLKILTPAPFHPKIKVQSRGGDQGDSVGGRDWVSIGPPTRRRHCSRTSSVSGKG